MTVRVRHLEGEDYPTVIAVVDAWWGGRSMAAMLPRLFFTSFRPTSFAAETDGRLAGFLCGFRSQTDQTRAYIHFVGVDPAARGLGIGRTLYERFFAAARDLGCTTAGSVTTPTNHGSIAFHLGMGFTAEPGAGDADGVPFTPDYDGPGEDRVRFVRAL